jgi:hypothetical protein
MDRSTSSTVGYRSRPMESADGSQGEQSRIPSADIVSLLPHPDRPEFVEGRGPLRMPIVDNVDRFADSLHSLDCSEATQGTASERKRARRPLFSRVSHWSKS